MRVIREVLSERMVREGLAERVIREFFAREKYMRRFV